MIRRPPRSTRVRSSAASDVYKRQGDPQAHPGGAWSWPGWISYEKRAILQCDFRPFGRILWSPPWRPQGPPRSDVFSRSDCDPRAQILDRAGNPENDASIFFVNLRIIGGPVSPFLDSVGRSEKRPRSRSGKEQPSFRNYRILPSTFLPDRTVRGPQRPTRPNPR